MKKISLIMLLLTITINVNALRYVSHESFTDPAYTSYKAKRVLIKVNANSKEMKLATEKYIIKYFAKTNIKIITYSKLFPPTRMWSNTTIHEYLLKSNLDSVLIINEGSRNKKATNYGSITNSNTNIRGSVNYLNNSFSGTANTSSTTTNLIHTKSKAEFNAVLIGIRTGLTAWYIDVIVKAGGSLFTTNKGDAKGVSKRIVKALLADNMVNKRWITK